MRDVYQWVQNLRADISYCSLSQNKSVSAEYNEQYYIGLDISLVQDTAQERTCLAHEAGHCQTGSFYNLYSPFDIRTKHEHRANSCAYETCLPAAEIQSAISNGYTEFWEIAELFGFTPNFVCDAITYYTENKGVIFECAEEI